MNYKTDKENFSLEIQESLEAKYDLDGRLIEFAGRIIDVSESCKNSRAGNHIAGQLLRSGTSPAPNYAEACAAESRNDFIHKMQICLKELRETFVWLRISINKKLVPSPLINETLTECEQLIRIFRSSITTTRKNNSKT